MNKIANTNSGFTLIEVLVSVVLVLLFLPIAANMLTNSQIIASFSKHKIQAAYAAQQIIETQRQTLWSNPANSVIPAGQSVIIGPQWVILDTKGNYNNSNATACTTPNSNIFCGQTVITVTPAVYTSSTGAVQPSSTLVDHLVVKIYWSEKEWNIFIPITETYAADIANDQNLILN